MAHVSALLVPKTEDEIPSPGALPLATGDVDHRSYQKTGASITMS